MSSEEDYVSEESYEFEFEEDEDIEQEDVEQDYRLENKYYSAKGLKDESPEGAINEFKTIIESSADEENSEWIFKSLKQVIKVYYRRGEYTHALEYLEKLIQFVPQVNKNYAEESINKILNVYSNCSDAEFVQKLYDIILDHLDGSNINNDRMWIRINMNKLNDLLESQKYDQCYDLIELVNAKLETVSEVTRNSFTLDLVAVEIECYSQQFRQNLTKVNQLYCKSLGITSGVTHPKIMGVIRECGAKVQFYRGNYERARLEFYECFKNYDEAGSPSKNKVLKYLSLCSMLTENEVNPFESQETQTYSQLPEYANLILLIRAYDQMNLNRFTQVKKLMDTQDELAGDEIFLHAFDQIEQNLKSKLLISYLKSYKSIRFSFLVDKLHINEEEVEDLLISLTSDGKVSDIKIDFIDKYIEVEPSSVKLTIDSKKIYNNFQVLQLMNFNGENNTRSPKFPYSLISNFVYNTKSQDDTKPQEWIGLISHWANYITSAVPPKVADELSQKDQIFSEQRNSVVATGQKEENEEEPTNMGLLGSVMTLTEHETQESQENVLLSDKISGLRVWNQQLRTYYDDFTEAYNGV